MIFFLVFLQGWDVMNKHKLIHPYPCRFSREYKPGPSLGLLCFLQLHSSKRWCFSREHDGWCWWQKGPSCLLCEYFSLYLFFPFEFELKWWMRRGEGCWHVIRVVVSMIILCITWRKICRYMQWWFVVYVYIQYVNIKPFFSSEMYRLYHGKPILCLKSYSAIRW